VRYTQCLVNSSARIPGPLLNTDFLCPVPQSGSHHSTGILDNFTARFLVTKGEADKCHMRNHTSTCVPGSQAPVYFYEFQHLLSFIKQVRPFYPKADHGDDTVFVFGSYFWGMTCESFLFPWAESASDEFPRDY